MKGDRKAELLQSSRSREMSKALRAARPFVFTLEMVINKGLNSATQ